MLHEQVEESPPSPSLATTLTLDVPGSGELHRAVTDVASALTSDMPLGCTV